MDIFSRQKRRPIEPQLSEADKYHERQERNRMSAQKTRDKKRFLEHEMQVRAASLAEERDREAARNEQLKSEVGVLSSLLAQLKMHVQQSTPAMASNLVSAKQNVASGRSFEPAVPNPQQSDFRMAMYCMWAMIIATASSVVSSNGNTSSTEKTRSPSSRLSSRVPTTTTTAASVKTTTASSTLTSMACKSFGGGSVPASVVAAAVESLPPPPSQVPISAQTPQGVISSALKDLASRLPMPSMSCCPVRGVLGRRPCSQEAGFHCATSSPQQPPVCSV